MDRHHRQRQYFCKGKTEKVYACISSVPKDHFKLHFLYVQNQFLFPSNTFVSLIPPFFLLVSLARNLRYL